MSAGRVYSLSEVAQHTTEENAWFVISNHVYDVSKFLDEHPGGKEVLLDVVGRDATNSFEDVGHSSDAREMLKQYEIGQLDPSDCKKGGLASCFTSGTSSISTLGLLVPLVFGVIAAASYRYYYTL